MTRSSDPDRRPTDDRPVRHAGHPGAPHDPGRRLAIAFGVAAMLAACGGGGGGFAGVGTGGTGSFAVGSISGFGSIVVNGVRYDDRAAEVVDDDGGVFSPGDLRLGMVVEVSGRLGDDRTSGTAQRIVFGAEIKGPVTAVDAAGGTFTVFGQPLRVTPSTVFDGAAGGLAGLAPGNVVEVYALPGADGPWVATRVEVEAGSVADYDGDFRVRGPVEGLTGSGSALRFTVSTVRVSTTAQTRIDGTLRAGSFVSVRLATDAGSDGRYRAQSVQVRDRGFGDDAGEAEIEGVVGGFVAPDRPFTVGGYPVRLGAAVEFDGGLAADLGDGVRVEVEGAVEAGELVVRKLEFERDEDDDDGGGDGSGAPFEFRGVADCSSCGPTDGRFTVRGVALRYDAATRFDDGLTPATLDGRSVEVKAVARNGSAGTVLVATRIEASD